MNNNYDDYYDNLDIRNNDYSIMNYVSQYYRPEYICLDIGCGSGRKIQEISNYVTKYYAIDINPKRIYTATKNSKSFTNMEFYIADNFFLPFSNSSFDLVSSFMTKYSITEIERVLKPDGAVIIELPGADDKRELRKLFGKDQLGWRARLLDDNTNDQTERLKKSMSPFFANINIRIISFSTRIKTDNLIRLLQMTGDIRNFDYQRDRNILLEVEDDEGYISFDEERIIAVGRKDVRPGNKL